MAFSAPVRLKSLSADATGQGSIGGSGFKIVNDAAVGDLVVAMVGFGLGSTPTITVTDSKSNTWTLCDRGDRLLVNTPHCAIYYSILTTALVNGVDYVTITFGTNVNYPVSLIYKTTPTAGKTASLDQVNHQTGGSTTSPSGDNVTTTGTDEILFGAIVSGPAQALTAGTGWTLVDQNAPTSSKRLDGEYRIESTIGTWTANGSFASAADYAGVIAAFKATSSGTTVTVPGPASATGAGGTSPAEVDLQAVAAATTASAPAAAPLAYSLPAAVTATASGLVPTISIGTSTVTINATVASASASAAGGAFGQGGFGQGGFGGDAPSPAIALVSSLPLATGAGLLPGVGQTIAVVVATGTAAGLTPLVNYSGTLTAVAAVATGTGGVSPALVSITPATVTATATALTPAQSLSVTATAGAATASALVASISAASVGVTAVAATASASTPNPDMAAAVVPTAAQAFGIAFGGILTAPVIVVEIAPSLPASAVGAPPPPSLVSTGSIAAPTADAHARALSVLFDLDLLAATEIQVLGFTETDIEGEPWLIRTDTNTLTLT